MNQGSGKPVIKVLGIGKAGNNVLEALKKQDVGLQLIAINTNKDILDKSTCGNKILIGNKTCLGKGSNRNSLLGEEAARESAEEIKRLLEGADMAIMVAGMGGGTGSGSTPVILNIAKSLRIPTLCVVFVPFKSEGDDCRKQAEISIENLGDRADAIISLSLQQINERYKNNKTNAATLSAANQIAAGWIKMTTMYNRQLYQ